MRPADANETAEAWASAIQHDGPTLFALTRQNVPHLDRTRHRNRTLRRALIFFPNPRGGAPDVIFIGTGSEVSLCMKAQEKLTGLRSEGPRCEYAELEFFRSAG